MTDFVLSPEDLAADPKEVFQLLEKLGEGYVLGESASEMDAFAFAVTGEHGGRASKRAVCVCACARSSAQLVTAEVVTSVRQFIFVRDEQLAHLDNVCLMLSFTVTRSSYGSVYKASSSGMCRELEQQRPLTHFS